MRNRITAYANAPNAREHEVKRLQGRSSLRLRSGVYRAIVEWRDGVLEILDVIDVAHRKEIYR